MKLSNLFKAPKPARAVQTAGEPSPLSRWQDCLPLRSPDCSLYTFMREAVPIIDAAIDKIVRLTVGFRLECDDPAHTALLCDFARNVRVGPCSRGLSQFASVYLDGLLTYGNAVAEIVLTSDASDVYALYNARLEDVQIRRGKSALEVEIGAVDGNRDFLPVKYPELVLFTPFCPPPGEIRGVSLLRSLPFVTGILLKIFNSLGTNFQRMANLRYAVTYKPGQNTLDRVHAQDIAENIAKEWQSAMQSQESGAIRDFVAVGDVDIKVIGADNQTLEAEIPVRQMLEQIVAKLGIPPFMLGLHWSATERMSSQQADILTSELESYRSLLEGVILRVCGLYLRLKGLGCKPRVIWDDINLQDEVETANARHINAQAALLEQDVKGGISA